MRTYIARSLSINNPYFNSTLINHFMKPKPDLDKSLADHFKHFKPKPKLRLKLNKYAVRLPDGKEVMVKAHDVTCDLRSNTGYGHIYFEKNGNVIYRFKEWIFWRKV